jgi:hypothetical protein
LQLGRHAAHRSRPRAAPHQPLDLLGDRLDRVELARGRVLLGIARVQAVDVGEQHEQVGVDERGDERAQVVVVADLDLFHRHRVVLVYDRQHAEAEQREQRVARVEVARAIRDVVRGQQHLPDRHAVALERLLVVPHERRLPHRRRRLLLGDGPRPLGQRQSRHAGRDRARRDQHDLASVADGRDLGGEGGDAIGIRSERRLRDEAGADLHDQPPHAS